eukprot:jgi/Mesen1/7239/ME000373S06310
MDVGEEEEANSSSFKSTIPLAKRLREMVQNVEHARVSMQVAALLQEVDPLNAYRPKKLKPALRDQLYSGIEFMLRDLEMWVCNMVEQGHLKPLTNEQTHTEWGDHQPGGGAELGPGDVGRSGAAGAGEPSIVGGSEGSEDVQLWSRRAVRVNGVRVEEEEKEEGGNARLKASRPDCESTLEPVAVEEGASPAWVANPTARVSGISTGSDSGQVEGEGGGETVAETETETETKSAQGGLDRRGSYVAAGGDCGAAPSGEDCCRLRQLDTSDDCQLVRRDGLAGPEAGPEAQAQAATGAAAREVWSDLRAHQRAEQPGGRAEQQVGAPACCEVAGEDTVRELCELVELVHGQLAAFTAKQQEKLLEQCNASLEALGRPLLQARSADTWSPGAPASFLERMKSDEGIASLVELARSTKRCTYEDVLASLQRSPPPAGDVELETTTLSLQCPLSCARIQVPARSRACVHLACFDLATHLRLNAASTVHGRRKWKCPVCHKSATWNELLVDGYVERVLTSEVRYQEVRILPDGAWRAMQTFPNGQKADVLPGDEAGTHEGDVLTDGEHAGGHLPGSISLLSDSEDELRGFSAACARGRAAHYLRARKLTLRQRARLRRPAQGQRTRRERLARGNSAAEGRDSGSRSGGGSGSGDGSSIRERKGGWRELRSLQEGSDRLGLLGQCGEMVL